MTWPAVENFTPLGQKIETVEKIVSFPFPAWPRRVARARIFWKSIANRLAWGTNGLGAHPGLRLGDGGPRAAGADRISGRRKPDLEGPVEGAVEAVGRRASHAS